MISSTLLSLVRFLFPRAAVAGLACGIGAVPSLMVMAEEGTARWEAPPLERAISVREGRSDQMLAWDEFLDSLAAAEVVFLGESHTDETTHRAQLAIYRALLERRNRQVVLGLEMFERDVQPALDAYLAGETNEEEFLAQSRPWANYRTAYRPLVEQARQSGAPVVASNFPRPLLRRVALEGPEILDALPESEQTWAPRTLFPNSDAYWRRADNATRGHRGMFRESDRLHSTQSLWDNAMGDSCALARQRWPEHLVLHINGDFHSSHWDGTVHQLRQRRPETRILTVSLVPVSHPAVAQLDGVPTADYVVFVEARAADRQDASWSVWSPKKMDYRLHVPAAASSESPAPLLILLVEEGLTAEETLELWRHTLGEEAAMAVLVPPYQERQPDLGLGGRWYWNDSFSSDLGTNVEAIERMWGYLCRHFPVDPSRVAIFGEGTGGTMAAATLLLTQRMDLEGIIWNPRQYAQLKDLPLPLPEEWGTQRPPRRAVQVVTAGRDGDWWREEVAEFREVGIEAVQQPLPDDPWQQEFDLENRLRKGLGLATRPASPDDERRYILLDSESPRARLWARWNACRLQRETGVPTAVTRQVPDRPGAQPIRVGVEPQSLLEPGQLPLCPGPFGGTTILVLPAGLTEPEQEAWLRLEEQDPLAAASRFHRLRVATWDGERQLEDVLRLLESQNRTNVLILPALFHAEADVMQRLQHAARSFEDRMTVHWLPGLGGPTRP